MPDKDKCFTCATLPNTVILYNIYIFALYMITVKKLLL